MRKPREIFWLSLPAKSMLTLVVQQWPAPLRRSSSRAKRVVPILQPIKEEVRGYNVSYQRVTTYQPYFRRHQSL